MICFNSAIIVTFVTAAATLANADEEFFESKYEDKFYCKTYYGKKTMTSERILVLSPEDYYFHR